MASTSAFRKTFLCVNAILLILLAFCCIVPVLYVLALSLSDAAMADAGRVSLLPVKFQWDSYKIVLARADFLGSFVVSVRRVLIGTTLNLMLTVVCAYPLSKDTSQFHWRTFYVWLFFLTILIPSSLVPTFIIVRNMGLMDTIWALVLPGAVPVWNIILMLNFFRTIPRAIEESAFLDGAGHITVLRRLYIPLSAPSVATVVLFCIVGHWNAWFDGMIYMNSPSHYPLQTFLRMIELQAAMEGMTSDDVRGLYNANNQTVRSAQVFIAMLPVLIVYPFLQKYFTKGIVLGSVKE